MNFLNWLLPKKKEEKVITFSDIKADLAALEVTNIKDTKKQLQHLDELISIAEMEIITLSKELDSIIREEKKVENEIKSINYPNSWSEQSLLLKLKRLRTHGENLKQRITIYSQNIELYLNMISRIQDLRAMKMGGLDESKIENIWLEYKEELEQYRNRLLTGHAASEKTTPLAELSDDLDKLRKELLPEPEPEPEPSIKRTIPIDEAFKELNEATISRETHDVCSTE